MSGGWTDPGRVAEYLSREIPNRDTAEALLLDALPARVDRFVDLGCGDGRLLRLVRGKDDPADRLAPLCDQLTWMRHAGFIEVDCRFKWLEMALMVGVRCPVA